MENSNWTDLFPKKPETFHNKIVQTLAALPKEEEKCKMNRKLSWKKVVILTAAAVLVLGTTAFALGKITGISSHSSSIADYKKLPDAGEIEKILGEKAKVVEEFSNGYRFTSGHVGDSQAQGENGEVIKKYKDLMFVYNKDKDVVSCFMNPSLGMDKSDGTILAETFKDIELNYLTYINKGVAGDYVMTEQDKADEESGKYVFSYGIETEPMHIQSLFWTDGNVDYELMVRDSALTREDLLAMAKEIIGK